MTVVERTGTAVAAALAADAALLEMAEELGLSDLLDRGTPVTVTELAATARGPQTGAASFAGALGSAGLPRATDDPDRFAPSPDLAERRYAAGYLSWALNANRPYIDHAEATRWAS